VEVLQRRILSGISALCWSIWQNLILTLSQLTKPWTHRQGVATYPFSRPRKSHMHRRECGDSGSRLVLVSWDCSDKVPPTRWLKTREISSLSSEQAGSWVHGASGLNYLWSLQRGSFLSRPAPGACQQPLACRQMAPSLTLSSHAFFSMSVPSLG
jgi:hypothetical protein